MNSAPHCKCPHHKVGAILITLIGLSFLAGTYQVLSPMAADTCWQGLIVLLGLSKLFSGSCKCYMQS